MNVAKALLNLAVQQFPPERFETGLALQAELEEMHGLEALEWALGGLKLALVWNGGNLMKTFGYWLAVMCTALGAGWLYTHGSVTFAFALIALGIGMSVFAKPSNAIPAVLMFASSLPVAQLLGFYSSAYGIIGALGSDSVHGDLKFDHGQLQGFVLITGVKPPNNVWKSGNFIQLLPSSEIIVLLLVALLGLGGGWLLHSILRNRQHRLRA